MPEPNLPPLHIALGPINRGSVNADELAKLLPELPEQTRCRLKETFNVTAEQAIILVVTSVKSIHDLISEYLVMIFYVSAAKLFHTI